MITATLASALAALTGGIVMLRRGDRGDAQGLGVELDAERSTPISRLKAVIQAGDWSLATPPLLVVGGILGVMTFGALAIIFVFDQPRSGWPMLAVAALTVGWVVREYVRA